MPVTSRPVKPWDYQRLLWNGSGLNSCETLVAQYLAWKARADADEQGWFSVSKADIGKACKLNRDTVAKYLKSLVAKGWAQFSQPPPVDGHYQAGRYRITQPVHAQAVGTGPCPSRGHGSMPKRWAQSAQAVGNEVRSYFTKDVDDGAPPSGGGGDGQENPNQTQAPPVPAQPQAAGPDGAEPEPNRYRGTDFQPRSEEELLDQLERDHGDNASGVPQFTAAGIIDRHINGDPAATIDCPSCQAPAGQTCRYLPPPKRYHQQRKAQARALIA